MTNGILSGVAIDERSFEMLYRKYWKKLFGICFNQTNDEQIAQEMVQDIYRSLWERRNTLEITTSIENYLVRAAKLEVMEYFRTKVNREQHLECLLSDYCESDYCTEHEVSTNDLKNHVDFLVDRLPCRCREVYKRSREQGMNNKEIASSLLISVKAVEYHLTKALSFLRQNLKEYQS